MAKTSIHDLPETQGLIKEFMHDYYLYYNVLLFYGSRKCGRFRIFDWPISLRKKSIKAYTKRDQLQLCLGGINSPFS